MYFHSLPFLFFLVVTFGLYWMLRARRRARLGVLLVASCVFYAVGTPFPLVLFFVGTVVDHLLVRGMEATEKPWLRRLLVTLGVVFNLGLLGTFKYAELFRQTAADLLRPHGIAIREEPFGLLLPVGLSFFCFQAISYVVDVYRREASGKHSFGTHLLYMLFFPIRVSGPITRAGDLLERFNRPPTLSPDEGGRALFRIAAGLVKKLVIADVLGSGLVDVVFANPGHYTSAECAMAAVAYTFELYFDFSGYSDIAIGVAALFGFKLPENFNKPYLARNLFEFWNRWHMSLSTWLRDYLYIPLGGNRVSKPRALFNLMTVMVLGGLWHGADWRFAVWGGVHGLALALTRIWWWVRGKPKEQGPLGIAFGVLSTFALVVMTRIVFRAKDLGAARAFFERIAEGTSGLANVSPWVWAMLAASVVTHVTPNGWFFRAGELFARMPVPVRAVALVLVGLGIRHLASVEARPYVYFQF